MLLLYAVATKKTLVNVISQQNYCIVFGNHASHILNCIFCFFIKTEKLQNFYIVSVAVILNLAVSLRAVNSPLLYALALLKLFATSLHRPKLVTLPKGIISLWMVSLS